MRDGPGGHRHAPHHRQHRNAHGPVVIAEQQGQGPEMGGSPDHHQAEQPPTGPGEAAAGGGDPHQGRNGASHATDDDVLGRAGLEQGGVEQHVATQPQQRQAGGQGIHPPHQHRHSGGGQTDRHGEGLALGQTTRGQGTTAGALHAAVQFLLPEAIEHPGGGGGQAAAHQGANDGAGGHRPAITDGHAGQGGGQQQGDQPRLGHLQPGGQAPRTGLGPGTLGTRGLGGRRRRDGYGR